MRLETLRAAAPDPQSPGKGPVEGLCKICWVKEREELGRRGFGSLFYRNRYKDWQKVQVASIEGHWS